ncbi:hypothetical protein HK101_004958, partial [Irineochytrium annulatum]
MRKFSSEDVKDTSVFLDLIQRICLTHPASKRRMSKPDGLDLLLVHLNHPREGVVISALECIEAVIVGSCESMRAFEDRGALDRVCGMLSHRLGNEGVLGKCIELLFVYLTDEADFLHIVAGEQQQAAPVSLQRKEDRVAAKLGSAFVDKLRATFAQIRSRIPTRTNTADASKPPLAAAMASNPTPATDTAPPPRPVLLLKKTVPTRTSSTPSASTYTYEAPVRRPSGTVRFDRNVTVASAAPAAHIRKGLGRWREMEEEAEWGGVE